LPRKEPVLVHCNSGKDRTGLLLTYYLITRKGFNAKRAIREIRRLKPNALSAKGYEDFIYALEDWMIGRREVIAALDEESKQTVAAGPLEESSAAQEGRRAAPSPRPGTR
jgi:hypothetical protein